MELQVNFSLQVEEKREVCKDPDVKIYVGKYLNDYLNLHFYQNCLLEFKLNLVLFTLFIIL